MGHNSLLLLPGLAAVGYVLAAILLKNAIDHGASELQVNFGTNLVLALSYQPLWFFSSAPLSAGLFLLPAGCSVTFSLGQFFTFSALKHGDVSVATPLLGTKVLLTAVFAALFFGQTLSLKWWLASAASTLGVFLVTGAAPRAILPRMFQRDSVMSLGAAASFALTDVLVQQWAPKVGVCAFIPIMFGMVGIVSLALPAFGGFRNAVSPPRAARAPLAGGSILLAAQALAMALSLSYYGNATAVNVVYSSRSIWSVLLAWAGAGIMRSSERDLPAAVMRRRLAGSCLLFAAIVAALV